MFKLIISLCLLSITTELVHGKYLYRPKIKGWIKNHKYVADWSEAYARCRSEDYAVLASPLTEELKNEMKALIGISNVPHFIGATNYFYPGHEVRSIEGVPLSEMPIDDMYESLDARRGQCLSMTKENITVVPCSARLPFICYKRQEEVATNECGTFDTGYNMLSSESCYKVHNETEKWSTAYSICDAEGGYLAIINDEVEAEIMRNLTSSNKPWMWVGIRDWNGDGDWMSVHGERIDQLHNEWIDEKPTDNTCGAVVYKSGKLDGANCTVLAPFVCEKDLGNSRFRNEQVSLTREIY